VIHPLRIFPVLAVFILANAVSADVLTGRVVDAKGNGIPGVKIDVKNLAGPDPIVMDDETDAFGNFEATLPAGFYDVMFEPPAPPLATFLPAEIESILVVGVIDVGTIGLELGVSLTGRLLDTNLVPVVNVDLDVRDPSVGGDILLLDDNTDALGTFTIVVPTRPIELQIDPTTALPGTGVLAPQELELEPLANVDLGDIMLLPGFRISGLLLDHLGFPVANADFDFEDNTSGRDIYTPGDNTDAFGLFQIIVPQGTYEVSICPSLSYLLAPRAFRGVVVQGDRNAGIVTLNPGVLLTGTITDCFGMPVQGADIDLRSVPQLERVLLCNDNTDAVGNYAVVVPPGTYHVFYGSNSLGTGGFNAAVRVFSNTVSDGSIACCPGPGDVWIENGSGVNPVLLTTLNVPTVGSDLHFRIDATGITPGPVFVVGVPSLLSGLPSPAGEFLVNPLYQRAFTLSAVHSGAPLELTVGVPPDSAVCGRMLYAQGLLIEGLSGVLTNALALTAGQ